MTALRTLILSATLALNLAGCQPDSAQPARQPVAEQAARLDDSALKTEATQPQAETEAEAKIEAVAEEPEFSPDEPVTGGQAAAAAREAAGLDAPQAEADSQIWTGEGHPVSIRLEHVYTPGRPDYIMVIRSRADELTVYDLEINRGNCQHSHIEKVMVPVDMPFTLQFGQAKKVRVLCDKVIEASVVTQYGRITLGE